MTKAMKVLVGSGIISVLANGLPATFQKMSHGTDSKAVRGLTFFHFVRTSE